MNDADKIAVLQSKSHGVQLFVDSTGLLTIRLPLSSIHVLPALAAGLKDALQQAPETAESTDSPDVAKRVLKGAK
jgi:hypothetical protein